MWGLNNDVTNTDDQINQYIKEKKTIFYSSSPYALIGLFHIYGRSRYYIYYEITLIPIKSSHTARACIGMIDVTKTILPLEQKDWQSPLCRRPVILS